MAMNFVEKYMKFAEPLTEAPRRFHYYMAYMLLSCAVGKRAWNCGSGSFNISPNLWMIFIGPSSMTKKSTMLNIGIRHILKEVNMGDIQDFRYQSEGSYEAFVETVALNPQGIIAHSEFATFMGWVNKDYNGSLSSLLTDLFDQPDTYRRTVGTRKKRETFVINNPFLNIVTASTMEWVNSNLNEKNIIGGFLPRFNMILSSDTGKSVPISPPIDQELKTQLIMDMDKIRRTDYGEMKYTPEAIKKYIGWYNEFRQTHIIPGSTMSAPCFSRKTTEIHKFAMLNAIMRADGNKVNTIELQDFQSALEIITQIIEYTADIISEEIALTPFQVNRKRIMDIIKKESNGNGGAAHHLVLKKSKMKKRDFDEIIQTTIEDGTISPVKDDTCGRPRILYQLN